jgi:hypothetical protein
MTKEQSTIEELFHNLYRTHGYLEVLLGRPDGQRLGLLRNADLLLAASRARAAAALPNDRYLESLPEPFKPR